MRVIVFLKREAETQRVLWLNESKSGVYVGMFNGVTDVHASYHQDGTRHFRAVNAHHQRWKDVPLAAHSGLKQLMHSSIGITDHSFRLPTEPPTARDESIVLSENDFTGFDSLAVDVWLADSESEALLQRRGRTAHLANGFKSLALSTWRLQNFKGLCCGISLWAANTRASEVQA